MSDSIFTADFKETPYWWDAAPRPTLPQAALPATAVIVGSGQVGLSAALTLARGGRDVPIYTGDPWFLPLTMAYDNLRVRLAR